MFSEMLRRDLRNNMGWGRVDGMQQNLGIVENPPPPLLPMEILHGIQATINVWLSVKTLLVTQGRNHVLFSQKYHSSCIPNLHCADYTLSEGPTKVRSSVSRSESGDRRICSMGCSLILSHYIYI